MEIAIKLSIMGVIYLPCEYAEKPENRQLAIQGLLCANYCILSMHFIYVHQKIH